MNNPGTTVIDDTVYAVTQVELIAIDAIDGTVRWRYSEDLGSMKDAAIVHNDTIYVASGESYGSLAITALDRRSQSVQWRVSERPQSSCSAGPERLYVPLYRIS
jgi:outer membrane protein assembly factor BamB